MTNKRVLITGGGGFLGHSLMNYLRDKAARVTILDKLRMSKDDLGEEIEFIQADVRDYKLLCKATEGAQIVIHACSCQSFYNPKELYAVNVQGTSNILKASEANRVERFIYISAAAVYGIPHKVPIAEDYPLAGFGPLAESKIAAEKLCQDSRDKGDMLVTVFRPRPFTGTGRLGVFGILFDWIKEGKNIPLIGDGKNRCQLLDIIDTLEAIRLAMILSGDKVNDVFNLGAEEFGSIEQDLVRLFDFAGTGSKIMHLPEKPTKFILKILEKSKICPLYSGVYDIINLELSLSIEKAKNILGWLPKVSNAHSLINGYVWYLANCNNIKQGISNRNFLKEGILRLAKKVF